MNEAPDQLNYRILPATLARRSMLQRYHITRSQAECSSPQTLARYIFQNNFRINAIGIVGNQHQMRRSVVSGGTHDTGIFPYRTFQPIQLFPGQ